MMKLGGNSSTLRRLAGLAAAVFMAFALVAAPGEAATATAADTVHRFYDVLLTTMRDGPALGQQGRFRTLEPAVDRAFDLAYMTRMAVGSAWTDLSAAQRQRLVGAFGRYVTATYADRFDSYSGEKLQVTGEQPYAGGAVVQSRIVKSNGEPVTINYLMRRSGDNWQIADIYLTGTISELATRRSEFSSVLRRDGVDGLINLLNHKADMLVASSSRS